MVGIRLDKVLNTISIKNPNYEDLDQVMNNKNHTHKVTDPWSFEEDNPSVPLDRTNALTSEATLELQLKPEELQIVPDEAVPEEIKDGSRPI